MFTFLEMLALVESESSFGAYVCHRRPGGSIAISDLVRLPPHTLVAAGLVRSGKEGLRDTLSEQGTKGGDTQHSHG